MLNEIADYAESLDLALRIGFVDEREYNEVSVPNTSGRRRWFLLEDRSKENSSSQAESSSSSKEDEVQSVFRSDDERSENDAHVDIERDRQ